MPNKNWNTSEIPSLISSIYHQVLERPHDEEGLVHWGAMLDSGERSVRYVVRSIALSSEHTERFINNSTPQVAVKNCYRHLLARDADPEGLQYWTGVYNSEGIDNVINGLVWSEEYKSRFGANRVPG